MTLKQFSLFLQTHVPIPLLLLVGDLVALIFVKLALMSVELYYHSASTAARITTHHASGTSRLKIWHGVVGMRLVEIGMQGS